MRQQIVMLGAAPGAGKTALAQWLFEGMAAQGVSSCIYINLEMSREQILARSLSRIAKRQGMNINAVQILKGYQWTDEQRAAILRAAQEYKERIAPGMIYNPEGMSADLDTIIAYIEQEAQRIEKAGKPAPCVVIDYLQLLTGQPREDAAGIIKRAVMLFKGYAMRHNSLVFMIIAHNRQANSSGAVSMEAARDTSAIEYSADIQLALTFSKCLKRDGQKPKSPEELTKDERHYITLRTVKGRFGGAGTDVDLYFNGETMTYTQLETEYTETNEQTPFTSEKRRRL
jgi:replicative DNA helicase